METLLVLAAVFFLGAVSAFLMQRLRLPFLVGYLLIGLIFGPTILALPEHRVIIETFSQLGVAALLFVVGLGFHPTFLREAGRSSLLLGIGQILVTTIGGFLVGLAFKLSPLEAGYLAFAFALSSTIVIVKLLSDRRELGRLSGKITVGVLLVQDIAALLCLTFLSSMTAGAFDWRVAGTTLVRGLSVAVVLFITGKWFLPKLERLFSRSQELLLLFAIAWGLCIAMLFVWLGLSMELGALFAGIMLAVSPYHFELGAKMKPLRDIGLVCFFFLLGSQVTLVGFRPLIFPALGFIAFVLIGNPLIVMFLMRFMGHHRRTSFLTGIAMAQVSEFSFVLLALGARLGHVSSALLSLATVVGIVTIIGSSYLIRYADKLYAFLAPTLRLFEQAHPKTERHHRETFDVILFGCHRVGHDILQTLAHESRAYLVVDIDPQIIERLEAHHVSCRYGDVMDEAFLDEINIKKAKLIISTVPDLEAHFFLLEHTHLAQAKAIVIVMAHTVEEALALYKAGASYVMLPHAVGGNVASAMVESFGYDRKRFANAQKEHVKHLRKRQKESLLAPDLLMGEQKA